MSGSQRKRSERQRPTLLAQSVRKALGAEPLPHYEKRTMIKRGEELATTVVKVKQKWT